MTNKLTFHLFLLLSFILLLSCKPKPDLAIGTPQIKAGTAKITGKIMSGNELYKNDGSVEIFVSHPVSGELFKYTTAIDRSGKFSIDVDVETDVSLIGLYTSVKPYNSLLVKVRSGEVTNIDITYNLNLDIEDVQTTPEMNKYDMMRSLPVINQMVGVYDLTPEPQIALYDKRPEAYINFLKARVSEKLEILNKDSLISKELKQILTKDFTIWRYKVGVFNYEGSMKFNFRNMVKDSTTKIPEIQKIDSSYFAFLKDFNLDDPEYLVCSNFADFQNEILKNKTLALPEIAELDIPTWLTEVKAKLSSLIGFKEGQYYDVLAANAYGRQIITDKKPLTARQKKNISDYWKEGEIGKILLRKNQQGTKK